jgi:hypothetical protein
VFVFVTKTQGTGNGRAPRPWWGCDALRNPGSAGGYFWKKSTVPIPLPPPELAPGVLDSLAPERLQRFRRAVTGGSHVETLRLYVLDTELSAHYYGLFRTTEVLLRETIHRGLTTEFGLAWFRDPGLRAILDSRTTEVFDEADRAASTRRRPASAGAVVQQVMLGTWVKLLARGPRGRYEAGIWNRALAQVFHEAVAVGTTRGRAQVYELAQHLLWARNRVGHCQPVVFGFPLVGQLTAAGQHRRLTPHQLLDDVRTLVESMSTPVGGWIKTWDEIDGLLADPLVGRALAFMDRQPRVVMEGRR